MTASMRIEVGGSPSGIRVAAEWLRHKVEDTGDSIDYTSGVNVNGVDRGWSGASADAFSDISMDMVSAARQITDIAGPFAETLHVFAGKVERIQAHFEGFLKYAKECGLRVEGTEVFAPEWPYPEVPQSRDDPRYPAWKTFTDQRREYGRIQNDVVDWHADHEAWIFTNLIDYAAGLPMSSYADEMLDQLRTAGEIGKTAGESYLDLSWEQKAKDLQASAANYRDAAGELVRKSGVTGDPALKARMQEKIAAGLPEHLRGTASTMDSIADLVRASRKMLPVVGGALDIGFGVWDIAEGKEPVDVVVDWSGGAVGGAAGGGIAAAFGAPIVAVAGATVVGTLAVGGTVTGIWNATPPSWRDGIYSWTSDGFIVVGDFGEAVGDWWVDRWMDMTGEVAR